MSIWPRALRFLWEEEPASPPPGPAQVARGETTGVPRFLQRATRWSATAAVGATLMGQVIGVRLIAPVDAKPCYFPPNGCQAELRACLGRAVGDGHKIVECLRDYTACLKDSLNSQVD